MPGCLKIIMLCSASGSLTPTRSATSHIRGSYDTRSNSGSRSCSACPILLSACAGGRVNDPSAANASFSKKQRTLSAEPKNHSSLCRVCSSVVKIARGLFGACRSAIASARAISAAHSPADRNPGTSRYPSSA